MKEKIIRDYYQRRNYDEDIIVRDIGYISELEKYLSSELSIEKSLDTIEVVEIKNYIELMIKNEKNTTEHFIALARCFYLIKRNDIYIFFTSILGGVGVIENIKDRALKYSDEETVEKIFKDLPQIPLGSSLCELPKFTKELMKNLDKELPKEKYKKILIGNNHNVSKSSFDREREFYTKSSDIDSYLKELHNRKVEELQKMSINTFL